MLQFEVLLLVYCHRVMKLAPWDRSLSCYVWCQILARVMTSLSQPVQVSRSDQGFCICGGELALAVLATEEMYYAWHVYFVWATQGRLLQSDKWSTLAKYFLLSLSCYNLVVAYLPVRETLNQGLEHSCGIYEAVFDDLLHCAMCEGQSRYVKQESLIVHQAENLCFCTNSSQKLMIS